MTILSAAFLALIVPLSSFADLVRISHSPAAMMNASGKFTLNGTSESISYSEWKITTAVPDRSPFASGFVVAVKEGIPVKKDDSELLVTWTYMGKSTKYKAVYIVSNAHVWYNDRSEMQKDSQKINPNPGRYSMMVATNLQIYDSSSKQIFANTYFPETHPINSWQGRKYSFSLNNMGVRELRYCWADTNSEAIGRLNYNWGCDFVLIRILVPEWVDVKPVKIVQSSAWPGTQLKVRFSSSKTSNYILKKNYGPNSETFIADVDGRDYIVQSGWSGSPIFNSKTNEVVGIVASGWEGASTLMGAYSIKYLMENLRVEESINKDYEMLKGGLPGHILKGDFYGKYSHELLK